MANRDLKLYNGRPHGKYLRSQDYPKAHFNVAATSRKKAKEIIDKFADARVGQNEVKEYYSDCWGDDMARIVPTAPGLWITYRVVEEGRYVTKIEHHEWKE